MKNSQEKEQYIHDDYEDLTLFADESFDTGDVDLFEFSSENDSPLTRLKSIILSLDWEINDEILDELIEETCYLKEESPGDKIAGLYLQGLDKIGRYIKKRGAYAHHNAIKLLLTYYYNFEKITLTEELSDEEISLLVQGDIRKFRILQYQISQAEGLEKKKTTREEAEAEAEFVLPGVPQEEKDHIRVLKASILGLDWEVTDEGLQKFNQELTHFHEVLNHDKPALVLIQGLRALGDYILETKSNSHPESFALLHSFSEALEQVLAADKDTRDEKELKSILVEQVNRLNQLKAMIAGPAVKQEPVADEFLEKAVDVITTPEPEKSPAGETVEPEEEIFDQEEDLENQLDELFGTDTVAGMESSESRFPDEVLPPDAVEAVNDEVADDFIEAQVGGRGELEPALSETDDFFGFNEDTEPLDVPAQTDLDAQLDKLFADVGDEDEAAVHPTEKEAGEPEPALSDAFEPALSDFDLPAGDEEPPAPGTEEQQTALDIENKLDLFFTDEEPEEEGKVEAPAAPAEEDGFIPALADSEEERGFDIDDSLDDLEESPLDDIEEKLSFFFDGADPEPVLTEEEAELPAEEFEDFLLEKGEEGEPAEAVSELLEKEEPDFSEALTFPEEEEAKKDLENELDFFFDAEEDDEEEPALELDEALPSLAGKMLAGTGEDELAGLMDEEAAGELFEEAGETAEAPDETEEKEVHIAALGALLPGVVRTPSEEGLDKISKLINGLKHLDISGEERVVLQFLQGVLNQLPVHRRFIDVKATEKLINSLYEPLSVGEKISADALPKMTEQYMVWQQGVVANVVTQGPVILPMAQEDDPAKAVKDASSEMDLKQIREIVRKEFDQIKDELGKEE